MSYFDKQWSDEVILPDGSVASSKQDVDRFLRANNLARKEDYSDGYLKSIRWDNERNERAELFAEFIKNYKRSIWNEKE